MTDAQGEELSPTPIDASFVQLLRNMPALSSLSLQNLSDVNPQTPGVLEQLRTAP